MYYIRETWIRIYLYRIQNGSWTPKEVVFGPDIVYDDTWENDEF